MPSEHAGAPAPDRKAVLFCPECGHESPPDGDWRVRSAAAGRVYACPDCGERVTTRPSCRPGAEAAGRSWGALVGRWTSIAFVWAALPYAVSADGAGRQSTK